MHRSIEYQSEVNKCIRKSFYVLSLGCESGRFVTLHFITPINSRRRRSPAICRYISCASGSRKIVRGGLELQRSQCGRHCSAYRSTAQQVRCSRGNANSIMQPFNYLLIRPEFDFYKHRRDYKGITRAPALGVCVGLESDIGVHMRSVAPQSSEQIGRK